MPACFAWPRQIPPCNIASELSAHAAPDTPHFASPAMSRHPGRTTTRLLTPKPDCPRLPCHIAPSTVPPEHVPPCLPHPAEPIQTTSCLGLTDRVWPRLPYRAASYPSRPNLFMPRPALTLHVRVKPFLPRLTLTHPSKPDSTRSCLARPSRACLAARILSKPNSSRLTVPKLMLLILPHPLVARAAEFRSLPQANVLDPQTLPKPMRPFLLD